MNDIPIDIPMVIPTDAPINAIADDSQVTANNTIEKSEESEFLRKYKTLKKKSSMLIKNKPKRFDSAEYFVNLDKLKNKN